MNDSVNKKFLEGKLGQFAAEGIKTGKNNNLWCVIDNDIDSCGVFKGFNVASFASDDTALEYIAQNMNN